MSVTKFEESTVDSALLDIKKFGSKSGQRVIAICERIVMKRDSNNKLFISYVFRDVNGRRIVGRQFNIDDVNSVLDKSYEFVDNAVFVTASLSIFHGLYLDVAQVNVVSKEASLQIKDKFFSQQISKFDEEMETFEMMLNNFSNKTFDTICNNFNVRRKLIDGYDTNICQGFKSSPILLINNFCTILSTHMTAKKARETVLAYILVQAIEAASFKDPAAALKQLNILGDTISSDVDVMTRRLYELVEDTIYSLYGFTKNILLAGSISIVNIHTSVYSLLRIENDLADREGVFEYENQLYRGDRL